MKSMSRSMARMIAQRMRFVLLNAFYGFPCMYLELVEDSTCETCWVDGVSLGFNPDFIESLPDIKVLFCLAHETAHVVNLHCWRGVGKDPDVWNEACDYAINPVLKDAGFVIPDGCLFEEKFVGKSAELIYFELMQEKQSKAAKNKNQPANSGQQGASDQQGGSGKGQAQPQSQPSNKGLQQDCKKEGRDSKSPSSNDAGQNQSDKASTSGDEQEQSSSKGDQQESDKGSGGSEPKSMLGEVRQGKSPAKEQEWREIVRQAAVYAARAGQLSESNRRVVAEVCAIEVDWISLTHRFVQNIEPADYSWKRPHQNYLRLGLYVPSLSTPSLGDLWFGNDTSGSINDHQLSCAQKMLQQLMDDTVPRSLTVAHFDAEVTAVEEFERGDDVLLHPVGGGGTDYRPVFELIEERGESPAGLIFLTDLEGVFPEVEPDYPVLWLSTKRGSKAPFGETVYMDLRKH